MTDSPRLIETAFPLKQASIDSVHEKNVRHGHISTLHIWPARRPLAASRSALIATLLPDPGSPEERKRLSEKIGGKVVQVIKKKKLPNGRTEELKVQETVGGILHWGRETEHKAELDWFREQIRKAYGGRAPKVLDPFAGGGAIPLEAMRLGCEVTAVDINPVAWFILKCTLEYPQKLAGERRRLPDFALKDREFMEEFFKAGKFRKPQIRTFLRALGLDESDQDEPQMPGFGLDDSFLEAELAWHVRAWGRWVLREARKDLARYYPVYAEFQPSKQGGKAFDPRPITLVPIRDDGSLDVASLNREMENRRSPSSPEKNWLDDPLCPRWIPKPAVAYLWARTVKCKNCRATIPLLKTRWLVKKNDKRVLLHMTPRPDRTGVIFSIEAGVPQGGGNNAARREHDRRLGQGTMSRAGAWCPCCGKPGTVAMEMEDIRQQGLAKQLNFVVTAVVVEGLEGKEYRPPTDAELAAAYVSPGDLTAYFEGVPFGRPSEPLPSKDVPGIRVPLYGMESWADLFLPRQTLALGAVVRHTRRARELASTLGLESSWVNAIGAYLGAALGRLADYSSTVCLWASGEFVCHTFTRFALPITWDGVEGNPIGNASGNYAGGVDWVSRALEHLLKAGLGVPAPHVLRTSATTLQAGQADVIVTDPPYYGEIAYAALMDFFYIWLRRALFDLDSDFQEAFKDQLTPKWDHESGDGELIDDPSRFEGDRERSKAEYETGMARAFAACGEQLGPEGRLVVVFANKKPDAWETLLSALLRAGFVVDASWPIQTERQARMRAYASAALASSVWLVCKKRPALAKPGWDNTVLATMQKRIAEQLRDFWDSGIRGPDFVWAALGPALEVYSRHPIVKKADAAGELMSVSEFLRAVRRIVVDFVVGRVLSEATQSATAAESAAGLDDVTTYYLLHRHDFGMDDAPAGACILYAVSCNLSEGELADRYDILARTGGSEADEGEYTGEEEADAEAVGEEGTGSTFQLKTWKQRTRLGMGITPGGEGAGPIPLIDQAHRLMHLWRAGDQVKVDQYLEDRGLRRSQLFQQVLQALIELSPAASEERSLLESIMNHLRVRGVSAASAPELAFGSRTRP